MTTFVNGYGNLLNPNYDSKILWMVNYLEFGDG
jgi:hypothetical protein